MATLYFKYRSSKNQGFLTARFQFRITKNGKPKDVYFDALLDDKKFFVTKEYFDSVYKDPQLREKEKKSRSLEKRKFASTLDAEENKLREISIEAFNKVANPEDLKSDWFKKIIRSYLHPYLIEVPTKKASCENNLLDVIEHYKNNKTGLTLNSTKKMGVIKTKMERFQNDLGVKFKMEDINLSFRDQFVKWSTDNKYASGTIARDFGFIRTLCYYANDELDFPIDSKISRVKLKTEKIKNPFTNNRDNPEEILEPYLNEEEIKSLEDLNDLPEYLENARDLFLVGYETGQRISDYLRFDADMIKVIDGVTLIEFIQKKTKKQMLLPLSKRVLRILEKRDGEFPRRISDQKFNDYIKLVCEKAEINQKVLGVKKIKKLLDENDKDSGIWRGVAGYYTKSELISGHTARRSFCTNRYGKWATSDIMYFSGHSSEAMLLQYIKAKPVERALQIFKNLD